MEAATMRKHSHSAEEVNWAKGKIEELGNIKMKTLRINNVCDEYHRLFDKTLTVGGLYTWFRYIKNPELKKKYYYNKKNGGSRQPSERKELEVFKKSQFIVYINRKILGFEDRAELEAFMKENRVLSEDVKVFKILPVKVEYSVEIGG